MHDRLAEDGGRGGAVTGDVVGLGGDLLGELGARCSGTRPPSSISLAIVTPSLVIVGGPNFLSSTTLRPRGPSVIRTASASWSMPVAQRPDAPARQTVVASPCVSNSLVAALQSEGSSKSVVAGRPLSPCDVRCASITPVRQLLALSPVLSANRLYPIPATLRKCCRADRRRRTSRCTGAKETARLALQQRHAAGAAHPGPRGPRRAGTATPARRRIGSPSGR